jgi:hypothetical protein
VVEGKVETRGKDEIVAHGAGDRIADITIADGRLPRQPRLDFRSQADIQRETIFPEMTQFGVDIERFVDGGDFPELVPKSCLSR